MSAGCLFALIATCLCWSSTDSQEPPSYTWADWTALDEYVQSDDGYFSWTELAQYDYEGVTLYVINMTSQMWQDETFVDKAIWWHMMGVAIPDDIRHPDAGVLFIDGGSNKPDTTPPEKDDLANLAIAKLANDTGACSAYMKQVPNQPIVFSNDPSSMSRSEDSIIAWTWRTYVDAATKDPTVILRMPMTKAAKRALDAIHEVAKEKAPSTHIDRFVVSGASKRGWTTWSIACTDQRVIAMIPMVFSMINIEATVMNHFQDMDGAYSFAFAPYWNENLTAEFYNPDTQGVWDVEDMYRYRDRLDGVYKLEMVASGDEFFLCDDSLQWWEGMPGPKWMMMMPNAEHGMSPHYLEIYETACSFWVSILEGIPIPEVTWTMQETELGGLIVLSTKPQPVNITAYVATTLGSDARRDFRLAELNATSGEPIFHAVSWKRDIEVVDFGNGYEYGAAAEKVDGEWVGFFIEGSWEGPPPVEKYRMLLTTQVNIIPYTHPHGPCLTDAECYGYLV